jgi:hypothetical protein
MLMHMVNWRLVLLDTLVERTRLEFARLQQIPMADVSLDLLFHRRMEGAGAADVVMVMEVGALHRAGGRLETTQATTHVPQSRQTMRRGILPRLARGNIWVLRMMVHSHLTLGLIGTSFVHWAHFLVSDTSIKVDFSILFCSLLSFFLIFFPSRRDRG